MSTAMWKKCENERGFIYYEKNHSRQWDHHHYADLKSRLDECNQIQLPSYRLAYKFRALQNALNLNDVSLSTIRGVFERHKFGANENSLLLEACDLEAVLSDVYFAANKQQQNLNIDVDTATELMLNFIYNVFDANRQTHVEVIACKLTLALLSNCNLNNLYTFVFSLVCDHNNCVTRLRLHAILRRLIAITHYLDEDASFGLSMIDSSIQQCFNNSPGLVGIDEQAFYLWLVNAPPVFAWLPTLHRVRASQPVIHEAKCCVCKLSPIVGIKYKCTKCNAYVQCQRCFLYGRTSHAHKTTHSMKEHCKNSNEKQLKERFTSKLFKFLKCKYRVCDAIRIDVTLMANRPVAASLSNKSTVNGHLDEEHSPMQQLQLIIQQLERQSKKLEETLATHRKNANLKKCIEDHARQIGEQVQKLKVLGTRLHAKNASTGSLPKPDVTSPLVQSTPMIPSTFRTLPALDTLSPISQKPKQRTRFPDTLTNDDDCYTMNDISTWLGRPANVEHCPNQELRNDDKLSPFAQEQADLDDALTKLQQILTNNFSLDDINTLDNRQLKSAVNEVEDVLTTIIDSTELKSCTKF